MSLTVHDLSSRNTASTLGVKSAAKNSQCNRNFIIAWESGSGHHAAAVSLKIDTRASITLNRWAATDTWQTRGTRLAAEFAVEAAESTLSRAANAILSSVEATVGAAESTAETHSLFVDSVVISHLFLFFFYMNGTFISR